MLTALQQTHRGHFISDDDLLPVLARLRIGAGAPLTGEALEKVLKETRAEFRLEGDVRRSAQRFSLGVRLLSSGSQTLLEASFSDEPGPVSLAQTAALWIRSASGESARSIEASPSDIRTLTSSAPEALQKYYEGMEYYAVANMDLAILLFREAIRIDPSFAQAHSMLGMTLNGSRYDEAFRELETARALAAKLPRKERVAIEVNYYRLTEDPRKMVETAAETLADRPDEPRRHGLLAQAYGVSGRFPEAVESCRKALELAPDDWMQVLRLEETLVEAGRFAEALEVFRAALVRRVENKWIYNGAASALMALEQYPAALRHLAEQPAWDGGVIDEQFVKILTGNLVLATAALEEHRASGVDALSAFSSNEFLCGVYYALDQFAMARKCLSAIADIPVYPTMAGEFARAASWCRRLDDRPTLTRIRTAVSALAKQWPNARTEAIETHVQALDLWAANSPEEAARLLTAAVGKAWSLPALFDLAELCTSTAQWDLAAEYWAKFDTHRGTVIVKSWCPVMLVLGWLYRARAAQARNDFALAGSCAKKVLDHWQRLNPQLAIVSQAGRIFQATKPS